MTRPHKFFAVASFAAVIAAPGVARAQTGERAATQLFFAPTGRALPKGQAYFKGLDLAVPYVQGGVTDRFSVGIGTPIFGFGQGWVLSPKLQVQRSAKHSTSIGTLHFIDAREVYNVIYVAHTVERETGALHITVIRPTFDWSEPRAVAVMLGAEHRINSRVTFMTENYVFAGVAPILSGGVRIRGGHTTWDLGWLVPVGFRYGMPGAPMISAGWKF